MRTAHGFATPLVPQSLPPGFAMNMRIAITGCGGQLGGELCRRLGPQGIGLDLPQFDLADRDAVLHTLEELRPDAIVNTAAFTQVDKAETEVELCREINAGGVARLVEAAARLDCPLVQISTDYVFCGVTHRNTPLRETDEPSPQGVYAQTKWEGEAYAQAWPKHFIVRTCGLYGKPGPRTAGNFVETMLRLGAKGGPLRVVDDQRCTPTYVPHLARAILFLLSTKAYGTYHAVNGGETTWYRFAAEIFRQAALTVTLEPITTAQYGAGSAAGVQRARHLKVPCPGRSPCPALLARRSGRVPCVERAAVTTLFLQPCAAIMLCFHRVAPRARRREPPTWGRLPTCQRQECCRLAICSTSACCTLVATGQTLHV